MVGGKDMEGTKIVMKSGMTTILLNGVYTNLAAVRLAIVQAAPDLVADPHSFRQPERSSTIVMPDRLIMSGADIHYVKGKFAMTIYSALAWVFVVGAFLASLAINNATVTFFIMSFGMWLAWLVLSGSINHIGVSNLYVVVRNVYRPWKKKMYALSDIRQVVLTSYNGNNMMRLIFTDFRLKEVTAAKYKDEDWLELLKLMQGYGIDVKDENSFEEIVKPAQKRLSRYLSFYIVLWSLLGLLISVMLSVWIESLKVSENMLILFKLIWIVLTMALLIVGLKVAIRMAVKRAENKRMPGE